MGSGDGRSDERTAKAGAGSASIAVSAGIQFAASILIFLFLGQWLDRRLGTAPVFLLVCLFVGAGGSFYSMYRRLTAAQQREVEEQASRRAASKQAPGP